MTVFKVGDVVRLRDGYHQDLVNYRSTVTVVADNTGFLAGETRCARTGTLIGRWSQPASRFELVSRAAPTAFASCADTATPPACSNEKPKPTKLQEAREATLHAVRRLMYAHATIGQIDRHIDLVIREAKAEAIAEREAPEPKPYGRVLATASATCVNYRRVGDDVELTLRVRVPVHAAMARSPIDETDYRVTATSKGER
jgi:hypothetical protein